MTTSPRISAEFGVRSSELKSHIGKDRTSVGLSLSKYLLFSALMPSLSVKSRLSSVLSSWHPKPLNISLAMPLSAFRATFSFCWFRIKIFNNPLPACILRIFYPLVKYADKRAANEGTSLAALSLEPAATRAEVVTGTTEYYLPDQG